MCTPDQHQILTDRLDGLQAEITSLKAEVALLRAWADSWPAERERGAISALMKAEIDLYRKTAEEALTMLADRIHEEVGALQSGMTEGAQEAIASLAEEVRGWSTRMETRADVETKVTLVMQLHEKALEGHKAIMERIEALATAQQADEPRNMFVDRLIKEQREAEHRAEIRSKRLAATVKQVGTLVGTPVALLLSQLYTAANKWPPLASSALILVTLAVAVSIVAFLGWQVPAEEGGGGQAHGST